MIYWKSKANLAAERTKKARKNRNYAGNKKEKTGGRAFVIVLICLCGWWAVRKEGFFLDEIYSYGLANSSYVPFLSWLHGGEQVANGKLPEAVFTQSSF